MMIASGGRQAAWAPVIPLHLIKKKGPECHARKASKNHRVAAPSEHLAETPADHFVLPRRESLPEDAASLGIAVVDDIREGEYPVVQIKPLGRRELGALREPAVVQTALQAPHELGIRRMTDLPNDVTERRGHGSSWCLVHGGCVTGCVMVLATTEHPHIALHQVRVCLLPPAAPSPCKREVESSSAKHPVRRQLTGRQIQQKKSTTKRDWLLSFGKIYASRL
mmetsp:Transcript_51665/g.70411  ORF Transcript_51665/g.70411 Transcript_51665/m.70411 type:complete len:223 (+) Transcript_51665:122-790(+)